MKQTRSDYVRKVSGAIKIESLLLQVMGVQYGNVCSNLGLEKPI
jgi:hypothetical protein